MHLVDQSELARGVAKRDWHLIVFDQISSRLAPPSAFPCVFSQNAFKRSLLAFHFVEDTTSHTLTESTQALTEYVGISRNWDGNVNTARPLIMAFSEECIASVHLEDYHRFGWRILQFWHECDPSPWPGNVATDPHLPFWSMCHAGMQIFINMSAPAHKRRQSRNLGDHLVFVINPRERFDHVAGDHPEGRRMRTYIRDRIEAYDGIEHSPQLGSYEAGEIEWWQYGITEENQPRTDRCPFVHKYRGEAP